MFLSVPLYYNNIQSVFKNHYNTTLANVVISWWSLNINYPLRECMTSYNVHFLLFDIGFYLMYTFRQFFVFQVTGIFVFDLLLFSIFMIICGYNSINPQNFKLQVSALARWSIGSCIGSIVIYCYSLSSLKMSVTNSRLNVIHKLLIVCQAPLCPALLFRPNNPGRLTGTQLTIDDICETLSARYLSALYLNVGRFFLLDR
jgi:hypothetical protein